MLELVHGYCTAALDDVERSAGVSGLRALSDDVAAVVELLLSSDLLREVVSDSSIPNQARVAVVEDLLSGKVSGEALRVLSFAVGKERAGEVPKSIEQLAEQTETAARSAEEGSREIGEAPAGRGAALERIRGYADYEFETVAEQARVDEIEDQLFRLAHIVEGSDELRGALADPERPVELRVEVLRDLVSGKVDETTLRLVLYVVRAGRLRDVGGTLGFVAELAAAERGRRVAHVRAAVELTDDERDRLAAALAGIVHRPVELRVTVEPSLIGGVDVEIGDTVIDGTVRHRLDQLRETLLQRG